MKSTFMIVNKGFYYYFKLLHVTLHNCQIVVILQLSSISFVPTLREQNLRLLGQWIALPSTTTL